MKVDRGDIWLVNLEPTIGAEIRKTRPVVVIGSDAVGLLPIRLVAPLTGWKELSCRVWRSRTIFLRQDGVATPHPTD